MDNISRGKFAAMVIGIAVVSAVVGGVVGPLAFPMRESAALTRGFDYFLPRLDAGTIAIGGTENHGKPALEAGWPSRSLSPQFWMCVHRRDQSRIVLYYEDGRLFAAHGLGLDASRQDVWWFCDETKFAEYTRLAVKEQAAWVPSPR
jgi:hypothetical protein